MPIKINCAFHFVKATQLNYLLMSLSSSVLKRYNQVVLNFIWKDKSEKSRIIDIMVWIREMLNEPASALILSLQASCAQKIYPNPTWNSSKFICDTHSVFKYDLFPFIQISKIRLNSVQMIFTN